MILVQDGYGLGARHLLVRSNSPPWIAVSCTYRILQVGMVIEIRADGLLVYRSCQERIARAVDCDKVAGEKSGDG